MLLGYYRIQLFPIPYRSCQCINCKSANICSKVAIKNKMTFAIVLLPGQDSHIGCPALFDILIGIYLSPCVYLFPSPEISIMYAPAAFRHIHEKPLATAGIKHIQFHDLRDTFATLSLQNGVNVNNEV